MIKAIIFDLGGVLTYEGALSRFAKKHPERINMPLEELHSIIKKYWQPASTGIITADDFWAKTSREIGFDKDEFKSDIMSAVNINENMINFANSFKGKYKIGLLSNHIEDWSDTLIKKYHLDKIFDVIIISSKLRMAKPDIKIYKITADRLGVKAEECVFIDDKKINVLGANKAGMKGIWFINQKDLEEKIEQIVK